MGLYRGKIGLERLRKMFFVMLSVRERQMYEVRLRIKQQDLMTLEKVEQMMGQGRLMGM